MMTQIQEDVESLRKMIYCPYKGSLLMHTAYIQCKSWLAALDLQVYTHIRTFTRKLRSKAKLVLMMYMFLMFLFSQDKSA